MKSTLIHHDETPITPAARKLERNLRGRNRITGDRLDEGAWPRISCAIAGRLDLEVLITKLIDCLGVSYGIVNDLRGWPRDLAAGQRTYLLARAGVDGTDFTAGPVRESIRKRLYEDGLLLTLLEDAGIWQARANEAGDPLGLVELSVYTRERLDWLADQRMQVQLIRIGRALAG